MIYKVNDPYGEPTYFNEAVSSDAKQQAETLLHEKRVVFLRDEAHRFAITAEFHDGNGNTTLRTMQASDPDDMSYLVFNTLTGQYSVYPSKQLAIEANTAIQNEFLVSCGLGEVYEYASMEDAKPKQPVVIGAQTL